MSKGQQMRAMILRRGRRARERKREKDKERKTGEEKRVTSKGEP